MLLATMATTGPAALVAHAQAADSSIEYAENGTRPVGVFHAYDQDGEAIEWSLNGPDAAWFTIDGGVLSFREPPDYEHPRSAGGGNVEASNVYRVTIEANGAAHDVAVRVTDVDEAGVVKIDRPQPQVDRPLEARLLEEDEGAAVKGWQWARSRDRRTWTDIDGATSPRRSPEPDDLDMYLRATAAYADKFGPNKTASAVSANRVEARTLSNAGPSFAGPDGNEVTTVARSVTENSAVGSPVGRSVSATDEDDDTLLYELLDTPDLGDEDGARFTIDSLTGQIRVGKVLGADAGEREDEATSLAGDPPLPAGEEAGAAANSEYVLRVRVSDPSTASATVNVIVTVTNLNEPPEFDEDAPTVLKVRENADPLAITFGESDTPVSAATFAVTDEDGVTTGPDAYDDTAYTYSVTGADSGDLTLNEDDTLIFRNDHEPNYENKSSYSITIVGRSGEDERSLSATLDVTIEVVDTEDEGEVYLSQREPQVDKEVQAWVSDPDGGVSISRWTWERSNVITVDDDGNPSAECRDDPDTPDTAVTWPSGGEAVIDGAASPVYTPTLADVGSCLRATATYTDNIENEAGAADERVAGVTEAPVQASRAANAAPQFVDPSGRTSRRVPENTPAGDTIGPPVTAFDDDGDLLIYTLVGDDAAFFDVTRSNGQLLTKAPLDYEVRRSYTIDVTATDPSGASARMLVTVNVTDRDDPARIIGNGSIRFAENGTTPVGIFNAFRQGVGSVTWSITGPDADRFTIGRGVLRFREPPDYENPRSALAGNVYRLTVEAGGGVRDVEVTVTDVDEAGMVRIDRPQPQEERPLEASLSDDDHVAVERWQWARSADGATWTDIEEATSPRRSPTTADVDMYLRATAIYADGFGPGKRASAVTANRVEARTLSNAAPSFAVQDDDEDTLYIDVARSVDENSAVGSPVGRPVSATDPDEDILLYELLDTSDLEDEDDPRFTIDSLTGQIRVGKVLGADGEQREDEDSTNLAGSPALPTDEDADDADNSKYVLRVRVSDPSTASVTVNVIVTVADVNEPPEFDEDAPTLLRVEENQKHQNDQDVVPPVITLEDGETPVPATTFVATDQDSGDSTVSYSLSGADRAFFTIGRTTGTLAFKSTHKPDFENRSSYSITITARSGSGERSLSTALDVTVEVVDTDDPGTVALSQRQSEVGIRIHATAADADGGVIVRRWVWEQSTEVDACQGIAEEDWTPIIGISSAVYAPRQADSGRCLRATAFYSDNMGDDQQAMGVTEVPVGRHGSVGGAPEPEGGFVNAAPAFPDQDHVTEGDQSDTTSRTVPEDTKENTKAGRVIGTPVRAIDADKDLLTYTLGGPDASSFSIDRKTGQLKTKAPLNYEVRKTYTVVVTATDPFAAADSIVVTINVTDVDDPADITVLTAGRSQWARAERPGPVAEIPTPKPSFRILQVVERDGRLKVVESELADPRSSLPPTAPLELPGASIMPVEVTENRMAGDRDRIIGRTFTLRLVLDLQFHRRGRS